MGRFRGHGRLSATTTYRPLRGATRFEKQLSGHDGAAILGRRQLIPRPVYPPLSGACRPGRGFSLDETRSYTEVAEVSEVTEVRFYPRSSVRSESTVASVIINAAFPPREVTSGLPRLLQSREGPGSVLAMIHPLPRRSNEPESASWRIGPRDAVGPPGQSPRLAAVSSHESPGSGASVPLRARRADLRESLHS